MTPSIVNHPFFAFHPHETVEKGFKRILEQMSALAVMVAQHSQEKLSDSVHSTRVLIKRLRALLWFASPTLSPSKMNRAKASLQKASHLLATHRDLVVTRAILQMLSRKTSNLAYRKKLIQLSNESTDTTATHAKTVQALLQAVAILLKTIKTLKLHLKKHSHWPTASKRVSQAFLATNEARKRALKSHNPAKFHDWRKKAKRLLYLLQLTQVASETHISRLIARVDEIQAKLGDYHDSVVVQEHFRMNPPEGATPLLIRHSLKLLETRKQHLRSAVQKIARHIKSI